MSPRTGEIWCSDTVGHIHMNLLRRAGIDEPSRFHDLRHAFATLAHQNGVGAKTVSSLPGHYSVDFTLDIYTHITTRVQQEANDRMGRFMDAVVLGKSGARLYRSKMECIEFIVAKMRSWDKAKVGYMVKLTIILY